MDEPKCAAEEATHALADLFTRMMRPCKSSGCRYLLDWVEGQPVFRRDEKDLAIEEAINDAYGKAEDRGDEIVPWKLASSFPDPS